MDGFRFESDSGMDSGGRSEFTSGDGECEIGWKAGSGVDGDESVDNDGGRGEGLIVEHGDRSSGELDRGEFNDSGVRRGGEFDGEESSEDGVNGGGDLDGNGGDGRGRTISVDFNSQSVV